MTKIIGLTGGMGSGKSTVSRMLAKLGAAIIDADKLAHEAYLPGTETYRDLVKVFDQKIIDMDGTIDRKKLGAIVFKDPALLIRLNNIVHPRVFKMVKAQIEEYERHGYSVIIVDAPLLLEAGWKEAVDEVWVVVANESNVFKRAAKRTGLTEEHIGSRLHSQMPIAQKIRQADVVIHNDGTTDELKAKVEELWQKSFKH